jgi:putative component of membrane protein insertase Oxa1/YidC/SpoIIIJ protein YidD
VGAIGVYQRFVSPHKGFCCAHRACTGGLSCSAYAKLALLHRGFFAALPGIKERLRQCSEYATDPFKGKISEDDPGPLTRKDMKACVDGMTCGGCLALDPLAWMWS